MPERGGYKHNPEHTKLEEPNWKIKAMQLVGELGIADKIGRRRAEDIIGHSKIPEHLKAGGVYADIGSSLGQVMEEVMRRAGGKDVKFVGLEPRWKPTGKVRERLKEAGDRAAFVKGIGEHLPLKDKSLDGAIISFVLHYLPPEFQEKVMTAVKRALKEDGILFLVEDTPETDAERAAYSKWDERLSFGTSPDMHYKNDREIRAFLAQHGFELIDEAAWAEQSDKKSEGTIRHGSYIARRKTPH